MSWLLEEPLYVLVIGFVTCALLGGFWLQTGYRPLATAIVAVVGLTFALVLLERTVETDREKIEAMLQQAARDVEQNDLIAVLRLVHPSAKSIHQQATVEFSRWEFHRVSVKQNLEIAIQGDQQPRTATATFNVVVVLSARSGLTREPAGSRKERRVPQYITLKLQQVKDSWRIVQFDYQPPQVGYQRDP